MARIGRALSVALGVLVVLVLMVGCAREAEHDPAGAARSEPSSYEVDYGQSELYTQKDMDAAIDVVMAEFGTWKGCSMLRIAFTDDATCAEDVAYCNQLRAEDVPEFDAAMVLKSSFHSPSGKDAEGTAWNPDTDYDGWEWHLARTEGGAWRLLTWGY